MKKFRIILGFIISAVLVWWSVRGVDWNDFLNALKRISLVRISLIVVITMAVVFIRTYRWKLLLRDILPASFKHCFNYSNIGFLANSVLPARAGEVIRPVLFAQKTGTSKITILTTVILERFFDILAMLIFLLYAFLVVEAPAWVKRGGIILISLSLLFLLFFFFISRKKTIKIPFLDRATFIPARIRESIAGKVSNFHKGLTVFNSWRYFFSIMFLSVSVWAIYILTCYVIISSYDFPINLIDASIVCMVFISLSIMIPSSPGYFGPYQMACILALGLYGVAKSDALAISLLIQIPVFLINIIVGTISLTWEGASITSLDISSKNKDKALS
ncbi:MAG: flippase-like domain-containing protein [Candidatus Krumholzibacteriota bacterium]|nr:flippase-like domain-containing protein [Candidatus Krumholzibacteriota bacterium]